MTNQIAEPSHDSSLSFQTGLAIVCTEISSPVGDQLGDLHKVTPLSGTAADPKTHWKQSPFLRQNRSMAVASVGAVGDVSLHVRGVLTTWTSVLAIFWPQALDLPPQASGNHFPTGPSRLDCKSTASTPSVIRPYFPEYWAEVQGSHRAY